MINNYKRLEVLCREKDKITRLMFNKDKYYTEMFSDRVFMADQGPLSRYERLSVDLFNDNIDDIDLPKNINGFIISLADKTLLKNNNCSIIRTNKREILADVNPFMYCSYEELNELFKETANTIKNEYVSKKDSKKLRLTLK